MTRDVFSTLLSYKVQGGSFTGASSGSTCVCSKLERDVQFTQVRDSRTLALLPLSTTHCSSIETVSDSGWTARWYIYYSIHLRTCPNVGFHDHTGRFWTSLCFHDACLSSYSSALAYQVSSFSLDPLLTLVDESVISLACECHAIDTLCSSSSHCSEPHNSRRIPVQQCSAPFLPYQSSQGL